MKQRKQINKLKKILKQIKSYGPKMKELSDEQLAHLTVEFKERLSKKETLDDLLPEAFAAICEADYRILGKFPYDAQILGGIALHQGFLAEMNTGEGKTLVATLPLYLNALTGKSNILVTTNEYLALRDAEEMGEVYKFMGLTVAAGVKAKADEKFTNAEKKEIYACDIVYTTHSVLGFDYLFHNLVTSADDRFLREFYYVIIDEADSVLLDSAQTPLVISGSPRVQSNLYELADFFVTTLEEDKDYEKEEKKVWLTEEGIAYAEEFFGIENFYGEEHFEINRHVTLALRAQVLFEQEKEYVISDDGEIVLLDNGSGRMMPGVKLRGGQHQALEMKEKLEVSQESRSVASITYQNLFLLFPKMSGMSGTIEDAKDELLEIYGEKVLVIPPNRKVARIDAKDVYFADFESQFQAALDAALERHATRQPVLMVASTIAETEYLSHMLVEERIPHSILNANNAFWEADIIKEAGRLDAVTVATSMAGRGTDIKLQDGVKELGGLAVIGVGRMANIRQERQARGRAGRQGDPGYSRFFVSLEDEVVEAMGSKKWDKYIEGKRHISKRKLKKVINNAQRIGEENAISSRKRALDYDLVMRLQRNMLYKMRNDLLDGGEVDKKQIIEIAKGNIERFVKSEEELTEQMVSRYVLDNLSYCIDSTVMGIFSKLEDKKYVIKQLLYLVTQRLEEKEKELGSPEEMQRFMRIAALTAIDDAWVEEVDYLQQLQSAVTGRASAQRNLAYEYQKDGLEAYKRMEETIRKDIIRNIFLSSATIDEDNEMHLLLP